MLYVRANWPYVSFTQLPQLGTVTSAIIVLPFRSSEAQVWPNELR